MFEEYVNDKLNKNAELLVDSRVVPMKESIDDISQCVEILGDIIADIPQAIQKVDDKVLETKQELEQKISTLKLKKGDRGEKGTTGKNGKDGADGLDGLDGSPDTPNDIAKKLNTLTDIIDWKVLKDFKSLVNQDTLTTAIQTLENQTRFLIQANARNSSSTVSGTVTSVSVVSANGISGAVATATTTPAITLDISGLNATKIADGSVTSTEFQYINSLTSNAQTQINTKATNPMTSKNDIIIGDTGGVPIRLAENNTADPYALISQGNGTSQPISWVKTIGTNAINGINNAVNLITASNPVIETTGLTSTLSAYQLKNLTYAQYASSSTIARNDQIIDITGAGITLTLDTAVGFSGDFYYLLNNSGSTVTIDTTSSQVIGNQSYATSLTLQAGEVMQVYSDGANWKFPVMRQHSDIYVPSLTGVANITTVTLDYATWERIGNKVNVDLVVTVEPAANNTQTTFGIDLPLAQTFLNTYKVIGMGHIVDGSANTQHGCAIYADTTNNRAECTYYDTTGGTYQMNLHFSYMVTY